MRYLLLLLISSVFIVYPARTEVVDYYDSEEDDYLSQIVLVNGYPWGGVAFTKFQIDKDAFYFGLRFNLIKAERWSFKNADIILDGVSYVLAADSQSSQRISYTDYKNTALYPLYSPVISDLLKASKATIKVNFVGRNSITWNIPDDVLSEWRAVIGL